MTNHAFDYRQLLKGCSAFHQNEPRDAMYRVATFLVSHFWGQPDKVADGVGVLLLTWNSAFYRYGFLDFDALELCIREWSGALESYRQRDIDSLSPQKEEMELKGIFRNFLEALYLRGVNNKRLSPVSASKVLHALCPNFFPPWDDVIARAYECYWSDGSLSSPACYFNFMKKTQELKRQILEGFVSDHSLSREEASQGLILAHLGSGGSGQSLLKLIDEYNYSKYTKQWI